MSFNVLNIILTKKGQIKNIIIFANITFVLPLEYFKYMCICFHNSIPFEFVAEGL